MLDASGALQVSWTYPRARVSEAEIAQVAGYFEQALVALSVHCHERPLAQRWSLVDLSAGTKGRVTAAELALLEALCPQMDRLVPLTPLQQGLVFESLALPPGAMDPYHLRIELWALTMTKYAYAKKVTDHRALAGLPPPPLS